MRLCYFDDQIRLYQGDARNLDQINDDEVQLIFTSPPYNV